MSKVFDHQSGIIKSLYLSADCIYKDFCMSTKLISWQVDVVIYMIFFPVCYIFFLSFEFRVKIF